MDLLLVVKGKINWGKLKDGEFDRNFSLDLGFYQLCSEIS
jgi:hypothetical protein